MISVISRHPDIMSKYVMACSKIGHNGLLDIIRIRMIPTRQTAFPHQDQDGQMNISHEYQSLWNIIILLNSCRNINRENADMQRIDLNMIKDISRNPFDFLDMMI